MSEIPGLGDAAGLYLASLPAEKQGESQHEIYKFIRWFGRDRAFDNISPAQLDDYSDNAARSDPGHVEKLSLVRAFLSYAKKKGWTDTNLGIHLKAKKVKTKTVKTARKDTVESISMTREGYDKMITELEILKEERHVVTEEITRAAADKDFRENVPFHAAREKKGMIDGRIIEIEATLKAAVVVNEGKKSNHCVDIGKTFVLCDSSKGNELCYTLVGPREADPARGRISSVSPIGKAVMGKKQGDAVEFHAPSGVRKYQLKEIRS
ncbi:MAG: transcription elongation factor GreA [Dehalococcoidales bacterium]|jgi:transcription elongation factor GreA|nr:transcription elongation factor GreA [Dehalococcoidales bacterium]